MLRTVWKGLSLRSWVVLAAFLLGARIAPTSAQPPVTQPILAPAEGASPEHGEYLVSILACRLCHGENLTGGKTGGPGPPAGPNLRAILTKWAVEDFIRTMRTGVAMFAYLHALTTVKAPQ